ncbi:hypothetical protein [Lichenibacterium dinghuense]|uniref:hypothetical protein n=1 Tax=Lichenibacterium dinghuense TaxID=2895977 RepID=UPI001F2AAD7F|nr:hypothetical protein [Lichenibacterium sp. 6Y81]
MNDNIASANPEPGAAPPACALAVFGRDEGGKPHASRFEAKDATLAELAAGLMGMQVLRLETSEHRELGAKLAAGRVFESGRAFVPFVKGALFDQLAATPGAFTPARPSEAEAPATGPRKAGGGRPTQKASDGKPAVEKAAPGPATPPADRDALTVGHRCLAAEENQPEVWYLAEVTALKGPALLQLRWVGEGYAGEPPIVRHREHLALLPPAIAATLK